MAFGPCVVHSSNKGKCPKSQSEGLSEAFSGVGVLLAILLIGVPITQCGGTCPFLDPSESHHRFTVFLTISLKRTGGTWASQQEESISPKLNGYYLTRAVMPLSCAALGRPRAPYGNHQTLGKHIFFYFFVAQRNTVGICSFEGVEVFAHPQTGQMISEILSGGTDG